MSATQSWARMLNNMGFTPDPAKPLATIGSPGGRIRNATASESRAGRLAGGPAQAQVARASAEALGAMLRSRAFSAYFVVLARGPRTNPTFDEALCHTADTTTLRQPTQVLATFRRSGTVPAGALAGRLTPHAGRPFSEITFPTAASLPRGRLFLCRQQQNRCNSRTRASSFSGRKGVPLAGAQDNDMATPSPFAAYHAKSSDGTHTTLPCCVAVHPCHPRAATSAGVHRNGVMAGLDVLLGEAGRYYRPGRHSGSCWPCSVARRAGGVGDDRGGVRRDGSGHPFHASAV